MIFREGSLTALIGTESTVLGIRTHVGTVAGVYVYCPMAATNTVCCWCRSLEMLRISGPDLDSNNVPMLLQWVSLVSSLGIYYLQSCTTSWPISTINSTLAQHCGCGYKRQLPTAHSAIHSGFQTTLTRRGKETQTKTSISTGCCLWCYKHWYAALNSYIEFRRVQE